LYLYDAPPHLPQDTGYDAVEKNVRHSLGAEAVSSTSLSSFELELSVSKSMLESRALANQLLLVWSSVLSILR